MTSIFRNDFNNTLKDVAQDKILDKKDLLQLKNVSNVDEKVFVKFLEGAGDNVRINFKVKEPGINAIDYSIQMRLTEPENVDDPKYKFSSIAMSLPEVNIVIPDHKPNPGGVAVPDQVYNDFPNLKALDGILKVEDYDNIFINQSVTDLAKLPEGILTKLKSSGLNKIQIGDVKVTEMANNSELKNEKPRNWSEGSKWDDVPGVYNPNDKTVAIGVGRNGSQSLALHETAHAIGDLFNLDKSKEMIEHHKRLFNKLEPYLKGGDEPGNRAGTEETFAEGLATLINDGEQKAVERFDQPFVDFLKSEVIDKNK